MGEHVMTNDRNNTGGHHRGATGSKALATWATVLLFCGATADTLKDYYRAIDAHKSYNAFITVARDLQATLTNDQKPLSGMYITLLRAADLQRNHGFDRSPHRALPDAGR